MRKSPGLKLQASIVQDNVPVEIAHGVFVGSMHAAYNVDELKRLKITHILNLAGAYATFPDDFTYLSAHIRDKEYSNLLSCLPMALIFIQAGIQIGGVLIHCAGGRSRSPAIAISYLMVRTKLAYETALMHVKAARSVVSLNAGFEAQLKCLDAVHGDVWRAQQLYLRQNLDSLAKQFADGTITMSSHAKRYQAQQQKKLKQRDIPEPPMTPPLNGSTSRIPTPDRGCMLMDQVPNGFNLSIVSAGYHPPHFIPALRSMGTMFGCMKCDHQLFCASSIVLHRNEALESDHSQIGAHEDVQQNKSIPRSSTMPLNPGDQSSTGTLPSNPDDRKKRPLLAKLRLRPQSFRSNGSALSVKTSFNVNPQRDQERTQSDAALTSPRSTTVPSHRDGVLKSPTKATNKSDCDRPSVVRSVSPRQHGARRVSEFLRSLTPFKSSRRLFKESIEKPPQQHSKELSSSESKKLSTSKTAVILEPYAADSNEHSLDGNAAEWERCIRAIQTSGDDDETELAEQIQAVIDADLDMMTKWECGQWNIEPQNWFFDEILKASSGLLRCPNDSCDAIVGEWAWDGTRCSCGQTCQPGFLMNHSAIKILGVPLQAS